MDASEKPELPAGSDEPIQAADSGAPGSDEKTEPSQRSAMQRFIRDALVQVGDEIGPYRLLSVLGEGGCGIVYLAEQSQPIHRQVALKVIKPGMDSKQVIARFEGNNRRWR